MISFDNLSSTPEQKRKLLEIVLDCEEYFKELNEALNSKDGLMIYKNWYVAEFPKFHAHILLPTGTTYQGLRKITLKNSFYTNAENCSWIKIYSISEDVQSFDDIKSEIDTFIEQCSFPFELPSLNLKTLAGMLRYLSS